MPHLHFDEPLELPYPNAWYHDSENTIWRITDYFLGFDRIGYPYSSFPHREIVDEHGNVLQEAESVTDFRVEMDYLSTDYFSYGNICVPKIMVTVMPSSATDVPPEYPSVVSYEDPSTYPFPHGVGDWYNLSEVVSGYTEDSTYQTHVFTNDKINAPSESIWVIRSIEQIENGAVYTLTPDINLDAVIYNELKTATFTTTGELYAVVKKLIFDTSVIREWCIQEYSFEYPDAPYYIPEIDDSEPMTRLDLPISHDFVKPGITIRDTLRMLGKTFCCNIVQLGTRMDDANPNVYVDIQWASGTNYNMQAAHAIQSGTSVFSGIGSQASWNIAVQPEVEASVADYLAPFIGGITIGDIIEKDPALVNPSWKQYYPDINNKLLDSLESYTPEGYPDDYLISLDIFNYVQQRSQAWEVGYSGNTYTYYTPMSLHMPTVTFLIGNTGWKGHDVHYDPSVQMGFLNTIIWRLSKVTEFRHTNEYGSRSLDSGEGHPSPELQCFKLYGEHNEEYWGFISKIDFSFNDGVTIECRSTETIPLEGTDWEGRPFITDITTIIDGQEVSLYPDHVYSWHLRGVNCPTEDYSIGNTSAYYELTFDSDIKLPVGQRGQIIGDDSFIFEVVGVERKTRTKNQYVETCIITVNEIDEVIPDSSLVTVANETLDQLSYRLLGVHLPSIAINKNYVISSDWPYSGITKRQLAQWIYQLAGVSYCGYGQDLDIVGNERSYFAPSVCPTNVRHAFHFSENDTKSIDKADYLTPQIDKIWFTNDNTNSGFSYGTGTQQLTIPYNPLINTSDTSFIQPLFEKVNSLVAYTPMRIETFLGKITLSELIRIYAGNDAGTSGREYMTWMMYYDPEEDEYYYCPIFNWEASDSGIILQGTGSKDRRVSNTYLDYDTQQTSRYAKISSAASSAESTAGQVSSDVTALASRVNECEDDIAQNALDIQSKVSNTDYNGNTIISKINAIGVTQTINANRVDLSGYLPSSSFTGSNIISTINSTTTTGTINQDKLNLTGYVTATDLGSTGTVTVDGSRISGDISTPDYCIDNTGITFLDGFGVTTTIYPSTGLLTDFTGGSTVTVSGRTTYFYTDQFEVPENKHFYVEVTGSKPSGSSAVLPSGVVLADSVSPDTGNIIKEAVPASMPNAERFSFTYVGHTLADTTYYIWAKTDVSGDIQTNYTGWYM